MSDLILKNIIKKYENTQVIHNINLEINSGEFCVFVGPSGCGKSTLLRMIAGLEDISAGNVCIDNKDVTKKEPAEREVAMVFQTYALYPHMTVQQNIGFGLKMNNVSKSIIKTKVDAVAKILKLEPYMSRKPKELSGGQRQRVAIGRALVREPKVFLFDEPLSNLDAELRVEMRIEIARLHKEIGTTMIYVTHDQVEAMTLADKIVVLRDGIIEQVGSAIDIYENPDNKFVAGFMGSPSMNFINGTIVNNDITTSIFAEHTITAPPDTNGNIIIGLRPEHLRLDTTKNNLTVDIIEKLGSVDYYHVVNADNEKLIVEDKAKHGLKVGEKIGVQFDEQHLYFFDADSEKRIRELKSF